MLSFGAARALLVLHTAIGVSAVATGTHLVIWLRRYLRGEKPRRSTLVFAWWFFGLSLAAFLLGNTMYPTYKVEVRSAYLENKSLGEEQAIRDRALSQITGERPVTDDLVKRAAKAAKWFDVKEHWIALGLFCSGAVLLILSLWKPEDGPVLKPLVLGLAVIACGTTWLGAVIGVLTAAWRAV
ncbi:MAG: hypothetical protein QM831_18690 [Kofleriaceae bacterium]